MCLITFHIAQYPTYKLVLAANRDEVYARPTEAAHFWENQSTLLAGKDLEANGTWLGITKAGKIAAITNCHDGEFEEASHTKKKSRGKIVTNYLDSSLSPEDFLNELTAEKNAYLPFNVLLGTVDQLFHFNSREQNFTPLMPGTHSISNATLNTPWPKVSRTKEQINKLASEKDAYMESLFQMMMDETPAPDDQLPNTPLPLDLNRKVSAPFIKTDEFGTRCTTLILVDQENNVTFVERTYDDTQNYVDRTFEFTI